MSVPKILLINKPFDVLMGQQPYRTFKAENVCAIRMTWFQTSGHSTSDVAIRMFAAHRNPPIACAGQNLVINGTPFMDMRGSGPLADCLFDELSKAGDFRHIMLENRKSVKHRYYETKRSALILNLDHVGYAVPSKGTFYVSGHQTPVRLNIDPHISECVQKELLASSFYKTQTPWGTDLLLNADNVCGGTILPSWQRRVLRYTPFTHDKPTDETFVRVSFFYPFQAENCIVVNGAAHPAKTSEENVQRFYDAILAKRTPLSLKIEG